MNDSHFYHISKEIQLQIISLYKSGTSVKNISKQFNLQVETIYFYLHAYGINFNNKNNSKRISQSDIDRIINLYNDGMSIKNIALIVNHASKVVSKYINEYLFINNMHRREYAPRKYQINENYFDNIDTSDKAYILGFLYADGNNYCKKDSISISLKESDKYILEQMKEKIESEAPLTYIHKPKMNNYECSNQWSLRVVNSHISSTLNEHGLVPNKSLVLKFPIFISDDLMGHFVRGYLDGDGYIKSILTKSGALITLTSTYDFLDELLNYLHRKNIIDKGSVKKLKVNYITSTLSICNYEDMISFCNWIYKDKDLYLTRKYDRYIDLRNHYYNKKAA